MSDVVQVDEDEGPLTVIFTSRQVTATLLALLFMHSTIEAGEKEEAEMMISAIGAIGEALDRRSAANEKEDEFAKARVARKGESA
jgi:hypothetical protein